METEALRIAYLITTLTTGGAELQTCELACRMAQAGHQVLVISMTTPTALVERLQSAGVRVENLGMSKGMPDLRAILRLKHLLKPFAPHIVHTHLTHGNLLGRLVRLFTRIPYLISTIHSTMDRHGWSTLAYRLSDGLCNLTTGVSQAVVDRYVGLKAVAPGKCRVVWNGIDSSRYAAVMPATLVDGQPFRWLAAGRMTAAKDYPGLLQAMTILRDRGWDATRLQLSIAGVGELSETLRDQCSAWELDNQVHFAGLVSNMPEFFAQGHAFVMSSAWEGFGLVVAEALAAGLPVVSTDCGGTRDILGKDEYGTLVPPSEPSLLANAMEKMMIKLYRSTQEQLNLRQAAGRDWVGKQFSMDSISLTWQALYRAGSLGVSEHCKLP